MEGKTYMGISSIKKNLYLSLYSVFDYSDVALGMKSWTLILIIWSNHHKKKQTEKFQQERRLIVQNVESQDPDKGNTHAM